MQPEPVGISVIICCHNSASRLPETLRHLSAQDAPKSLPWEVIVVDNASSDGTREAALRAWPASAPARLRVVAEPQPGLRFARERGQHEACWPVLSFIDDDNWVDRDWVRLAAEIFAERPRVAACGGFSEAVFEIPAPAWFNRFAHCYAVGPQGDPTSDFPGPRPQLWGAGLNVRRSAMDGIYAHGFRPMSVGRQGRRLYAGEDSELCIALRLAGWELWYDPRLRLRHYLPAGRLEWDYLRKMVRGFGESLMDPYWHQADATQRALPAWRRSWLAVVLREVRSVPRWLPGWWRSRRGRGEGDPVVLDAERALGRLGTLLRAAGTFGERCRAVREAPWRAMGPP